MHSHAHPNNCSILKINEVLVSVSNGSGFQTHTCTRLHAPKVCVGVEVKGVVGGRNHTHIFMCASGAREDETGDDDIIQTKHVACVYH